ncbi:hypothetical protein LOTGIDRAFT_233397 [Lottia gigantea]|uniref:Uncharacterized protein n=1 Tax=Lottia gigantea TaxID=225164 RepID=V4BRS6_LOTGI|nr:hypothetical protein LOTGIDRAFT_233397 [Lottia gigantea]ESO91614.1 hypothetical protein LOTGIDRAFT_233397 [Lottia gigantea]
MAAKMTSMLVCCIAIVILESTSVLGFFHPPMPDCKTDASCGADSVTASYGAINYCCASGSKLSLGVESVNGQMKSTCKCVKPFSFQSLMPKGFQVPRFCTRYEAGQPIPCGENADTGTANNKNVCCGTGYTLHITSKIKRGVTKEHCRCRAVSAAAPAAPAAPPPGGAVPLSHHHHQEALPHHHHQEVQLHPLQVHCKQQCLSLKSRVLDSPFPGFIKT